MKNTSTANEFRPFDLSNIAFNSMQELLLDRLMQNVGDKCQFAYKKGVYCIDAVILLIHNIVSHLDCKETTNITKVLFLDFSSALKTVLPNQLLTLSLT